MKNEDLYVYKKSDFYEDYISSQKEYYEREQVDTLLAEKDREIAELKQKLEDVQASAYAESVDAGMRERRLRMAVWLARARTAYLEFRLFVKDVVDADDNIEVDNAERLAIKWKKVECKCLKKAEEYK